MFVETVKNRNSPPCILLRETFREAGKVRHRTLANITALPGEVVAGLRELLNSHHPSPQRRHPLQHLGGSLRLRE
jgi:hypothetical protein